MTCRVAHIVNVTEDKEGNPSYLNVAQPITIKSMVTAVKDLPSGLEVDLFSVQLRKEKQREMPAKFNVLPPLLKDVGGYHQFEGLYKSVPRVYDILLSLYLHSTAEYFIYTNVDIGVQPNFYTKIYDLIQKGHDAVCINRRDIAKNYKGVVLTESDMDIIYKAKGSQHGGKDCFLFRRDAFHKFNFANMVIGYPPIGTYFRDEVRRHSKNFHWVRNGAKVYLTFHLGRDEDWRRGSEWKNGHLVKTPPRGVLQYNLKQLRFLEKNYSNEHKKKYNQFELEGKINPGKPIKPINERWEKLREKYEYGKQQD